MSQRPTTSSGPRHPPRPIAPVAPNGGVRVLLVDDDVDRAASVREVLAAEGYVVITEPTSPDALYTSVQRLAPDVIIIDTESPSRDALEHIALISREAPKPIIMFSSDDSSDAIRQAVRAGVSAYVVDGFNPHRLHTILRVAVERFSAEQSLRSELADTKDALAERKLVDRARGLIMKREGVDEEEAFRLLRKFAMDHGHRLGDASQRMIDILTALG